MFLCLDDDGDDDYRLLADFIVSESRWLHQACSAVHAGAPQLSAQFPFVSCLIECMSICWHVGPLLVCISAWGNASQCCRSGSCKRRSIVFICQRRQCCSEDIPCDSCKTVKPVQSGYAKAHMEHLSLLLISSDGHSQQISRYMNDMNRSWRE